MKPVEKVDVLISGGIVITMDGQERIIPNGAVAVRGSRIHLVGAVDEVEKVVVPEITVDASGMVILPGLVNAHTHAAMTLFRGLADDIPLKPWLEKIWPLELKYATAGNVVLGSELAFGEMISGGTTTAADMYWHFYEAAEAAKRVGFRLFTGVVALDAIDGETSESRENSMRAFIDRYKEDPLITPCVEVHGIYTVSKDTLLIAKRVAHEKEVVFVTHASETQQEVAGSVEQHGVTPVRYLEQVGLLNSATLLAHGVYLDDEEIQLLERRGTSVVHCPSSNLKLGSGIARVADMLKAGVNVAIGTDGVASNNDLDMWEEMRLAALLQKGIHLDPTVLPAKQVLKMATLGGARALNLENEIGSLEPGKRADLIVVNLNSLNLTPMYDVVSHLVYAANAHDVWMTMIDGKIVYRDGELLTIDEEKIKTAMRALSAKMAQGQWIKRVCQSRTLFQKWASKYRPAKLYGPEFVSKVKRKSLKRISVSLREWLRLIRG